MQIAQAYIDHALLVLIAERYRANVMEPGARDTPESLAVLKADMLTLLTAFGVRYGQRAGD